MEKQHSNQYVYVALTMSMDLMGPNGIMAARFVGSPTFSANPPTYSTLRDVSIAMLLVNE